MERKSIVVESEALARYGGQLAKVNAELGTEALMADVTDTGPMSELYAEILAGMGSEDLLPIAPGQVRADSSGSEIRIISPALRYPPEWAVQYPSGHRSYLSTRTILQLYPAVR